MRSALAALAMTAASWAVAQGNTEGSLTVEAPRILAPVPGAATAAGILVIRNGTSETEQLVSVTSPDMPVRLMHNVEVGDEMRLVPVDRLAIPRGKDLAFTTGALHMVFDLPEGGLAPGDRVATTFVFETAGKLDVVFVVAPAGSDRTSE